MVSRSRRNAKSEGFLSDEFLFWLACGVLAYSSIVLMLALESMATAELALRFQPLNQIAITGLVLLGTLGLFCKVLVSGWKTTYLLPLVALLLLLPGIKPSEECCSDLIAFIARHPSATAPALSGVLWHACPMFGSGLLIASETGNRRSERRRAITKR